MPCSKRAALRTSIAMARSASTIGTAAGWPRRWSCCLKSDCQKSLEANASQATSLPNIDALACASCSFFYVHNSRCSTAAQTEQAPFDERLHRLLFGRLNIEHFVQLGHLEDLHDVFVDVAHLEIDFALFAL